MGKINVEIFKSSFSKNNTNQYKLSILLGMDSFCYSVCSPSKELLLLKKINLDKSNPHRSLADQVTAVFTQESLLLLPYQQIKVFFIAPHYTIIPNRLYSEADRAQYLIPLRESPAYKERFLSDSLSSISSQLIYTIPEGLVKYLDKVFDRKYQLRHSFTSLIEEFSGQAGKGKELFVNIQDYVMQLFFFDNKELIFSNQFTYGSEKDFLYYILLVFDQFKLNPTEVPLKIAGTLSEDSTIYNQLYRYIQNISFINLPEVFRTDLDLKDHPEHLFFDMLHSS